MAKGQINVEQMGSALVTEVTQIEASRDHLIGFALDQPRPDARTLGHTLTVRGWVLGRERWVREVEIIHRDTVIASGKVRQVRLDLETLFPGNEQSAQCGFTLAVGLLGLPPECTFIATAILDDGLRVPFTAFVVRRHLLGTGYRLAPTPVLVTSLGRTGTTYLMRLLLKHPEIVGVDAYPYETRLAGYWAHLMKVLADPADHERSAHPDNFQYNFHWAGHNPYSTPGHPASGWLSAEYLSHTVCFAQSSTRAFYLNLSRESGCVGAKYFVEKANPGLTSRLLRELYPESREIFLVRDFRDMLSSILAFNKRRGYPAFGRESAGSNQEFIANLGMSAHHLLDDWLERGKTSTLIRYEDLLEDPELTLTGLFEYLGVGINSVMLSDMIRDANIDNPELVVHKTSKTASMSIGRWERDLDLTTLGACTVAFGDPLRAFGYT